MRSRTTLLAGTVLAGALLAPLVAPAPLAGAATPTPRSTPAIDAGVAWLDGQQQADGGFEVGGFPGFETPDAVLALATAGQTTGTWSEAEALAAVEVVTTPGGKDALDALDDWVDGVQGGTGSAAAKAQQAAKVIALVTVPLGLDATDFDPSADSATAVDLVAALTGGAGTGDYAALPFNGRAFAAWALAALGETVPAALLTGIDAAQQANGAWTYLGDPTGTGYDPDTTAATLIGLHLAGRTLEGDATLREGVVALGLSQAWDGEWAGEFDDGNPNSTAMVALALATLGSRPSGGWCVLHGASGFLQGVPFRSPVTALTRRQGTDGRVSSPSDGFGVNTFATTQAIQALAAEEGAWPYGEPEPCDVVGLVGNRRVVHAQYVDLLVRLADEDGAAYWTTQMDSGLSAGFLAKRFTGTPEYGRRVVTRLVRTYLGRAATGEEQAQGAPAVVAGGRFQVAAAILGGEEYYEATAPTFPSGPATDETWIAALYPDTVGRAASAGDVAFVLAQLEAGRSRTQIARGLIGTAEGRGVAVRDIYRVLLRRDPSGPDRTYWGGLLRTGTSPERLVTLIAGSIEYRTLAGAAGA